jgi:uncharacterized membrane protein YccC
MTLALDRALNTAIGGVLAILIYIVWPTWEWPRLARNLIARLQAQQHYALAILKSYVNSSSYDHFKLDQARLEARLERSNAHASVERALHEPAARWPEIEIAQSWLAAEDRLARSLLILDSNLQDNPARHALSELEPFASCLDKSFQALLTSAETQQMVPDLSDLKHSLKQLRTALIEKQSPGNDYHLVLSEAKNIERSLETIRELLSSQFSWRAGQPEHRWH